MLPYIISQQIIKYLHEVKGFSVEEIANTISMPVKDIKSVSKGSKTLDQKNIQSLIEKSEFSLMSIIAEACPEHNLPNKLREKIRIYKQLQKIQEKRKK